jgi:hypothetical protein
MTHQVDTGGLRNEEPLTKDQKAQILSYAICLGMSKETILFSENIHNTSYASLFGEERLYIGTDVLPAAKKGTANSRVSMRGAIAHELVGHRRAALAGKTQENDLLEEVQASIRGARFAPQLTLTERITLIRDALERLKKARLSIKTVKKQLWINEL